jgi:hypothetical protein
VATVKERNSVAVLICDAGAAGLALAIDLARRGVSFHIIDKSDTPFAGSRGKGIQPRTQEVFEDLDIIDRIVAAGGVYPPQRMYRDDGGYTESDLIERHDPTPAEPYHIALLVPQFLTGLGRDAWHRFNDKDMARQVAICPLVGTDLFQIQAPIPAEGEFDLSAQGINTFIAERLERSDIRV